MPVILGRPRIQPFVRTKSISATYTVTLADAGWLLVVDTTAGNITINLPAVATAGDGFVVTIKRISAGANTLTIDPSGAETVDGAATLALATQYQSVTMVSRSTGWFNGGMALSVPPVSQATTVSAGVGLTGGGALSGSISLAASPTKFTMDVQVFTASGTWTKPTGAAWTEVSGCGGGGGGARLTSNADPGGGGGAGYFWKTFASSALAATVAVTIGAAGAGRTGSNGNGTAGGATTFGAHLTGNGGAAGTTSVGGTGGTASGGDINITGGTGLNWVDNRSGGGGVGGGLGNPGWRDSDGDQINATGYGAGGAGNLNANAGNGGGGILVARTFCIVA